MGAVLLLLQAAWAAPLEVYGRLPHLEDFALSPDGTRIAFVKTEGNTRISRSGTRLQMLQESVAFLRAHNPPDQPSH